VANGAGLIQLAWMFWRGTHLQVENKTQSRWINLFKIAVSLVGVLIIVLTQDLGEALRLLSELNWLPFLAALLLFILGVPVRSYRWGTLVWSLGVKVGWWRLVGLYFVGSFFNMFLPTGVGGDAVKMYELSRDDHKVAEAISSVLVDRFLGLFMLFAMALLALVLGQELVPPEVRLVIALVFVLSVVAVALLFQRTWIESLAKGLGLDRLLGRFKILRELYQSLHVYSKAALLRASMASVAFNLMLIVGYYFLGVAVGIDLSLWHYFLFVPVISAVLLIPSVGGFGIREGTTVLLFNQVGVGEAQALALALAYDLTLLVVGFIGASVYIVQGLREARQ